jgi:peroxiredoxin
LDVDVYVVLVNHQSAVAMKEKSGVGYDMLYDENLAMARHMGIIHKGAIPTKNRKLAKRMGLIDEGDAIPDEGIDLAAPATFLFDANGKVLWSYVATNYRVRPDTKDLLEAAEKHLRN